jgi:predicted MPP superfamily phosphohydrolase
MGLFDLILTRPNLGQPAFIKNGDNKFFACFAGLNDKLDIKSLLNDKLYLQSLPDSRAILESSEYIKTFQNWPDELKKRLIPLDVYDLKIYKNDWKAIPEPNRVPLIESLKYEYAYEVEVRFGNINTAIPQLFNIIQVTDLQQYNMTFHSAYIHNKDWHNFSFIHATDPHIAWRNDFIDKVIYRATGSYPDNYINNNENFRAFIKYANDLHKNNNCDFIIFTGDLIDYINVGEPHLAFQPNNNFEVFRDIIIGWSRYDLSTVERELEVPIFTVLGNHDWRPAEYPLVFVIELTTDGLNVLTKNYSDTFGLTVQQAVDYHKKLGGLVNWDANSDIENGTIKVPSFDAGNGIYFLSHLDEFPVPYRALINPDPDFVISLANHKIVAIDSGFDCGVITSIADYMFSEMDKPRWNLINGTPDGVGLNQNQINFLQENLNLDGLNIIAMHHPLVNFKESVLPQLFRQSERNSAAPVEFEYLKNYLIKINQISVRVPTQWLFDKTPYFRKGSRDQFSYVMGMAPLSGVYGVGDGVPVNRFNEIMQILSEKQVKLILSGHTHKSVEFITKQAGDGHEFYHDYYIDGKFKGKTATEIWKKDFVIPVEYSDTLDKSLNLQGWWDKHSPLHIQAPSVANPALPLGQTISHNLSGFAEKIGVLKIEIINDQIKFIKRIYFDKRVCASLRKAAEEKCSVPLSLRQLAKDMAREAESISMRELATGSTIEELVPV